MCRDPLELPLIHYAAVGTAGRARLTVRNKKTDAIVDINTIDLSQPAQRTAAARRIKSMFPKTPLHDVENELLRIAEVRLGMAPPEPAPLLTLAAALDAWQSTPDAPRIATGFRPLDDLTDGGLPLGTLTVLAGPPGSGKSALALQVCIGAMLTDPAVATLWGLGEMTPEALACRSVAVGSVLLGTQTVTMSRAGRRSPTAVAVAGELRADLGRRMSIVAPLTLDRIEEGLKATGAKIAVIDYLQLVRVDGAADRRQEVDAVVKSLRAMTIAHNVALVAVSNIARAVGRDSRIGAIGKESSEIDFAADLLFLADPDEHEDEQGQRMVRLRCLKHRHGRPYDIDAKFDGSLQVFTADEAEPFPEFSDDAQGARA